MRFEFATATRIVFGRGALNQIDTLTADMGQRILVISGNPPELTQPLLDKLSDYQTTLVYATGEPKVTDIQAGVQQARAERCDVVIGFGGGSAIDTAKAIAALMTNEGDPLNYLEVIGKGQKLVNPPVPFIAIPTTAGTGAEVTQNAVLYSPEHQVKVSLRSPLMLAKIALIDPELTLTVPPTITAQTGMDALTQVIEPYVSHLANPLTDALSREGMYRAARSLRRVYTHGDDIDAREDMALTSLFGGLALANAKLGAVHGFAGPLGGMYNAPHGAVCAALLPHATAVNIRAMQQRDTDNIAIKRYDEIGRILTGNPDANAQDAITWIQETGNLLNIPTLSEYGIKPDDYEEIIEKSAKSSSMKGNPIVLTHDEMAEILRRAY